MLLECFCIISFAGENVHKLTHPLIWSQLYKMDKVKQKLAKLEDEKGIVIEEKEDLKYEIKDLRSIIEDRVEKKQSLEAYNMELLKTIEEVSIEI